MRCPACDAAVDARDVSDRLVLCRTCGVLSDVTVSAALQPTPAVVLPAPSPAHWPAAIRVDGDVLTRRWFGALGLFLVPFAALWNLITWTVVLAMLFAPGVPIAFRAMPLGHAAVGVGLLWACAGLLLNRTQVEVRDGMLSRRVGPVPWPVSDVGPARVWAVLVEPRPVTRNGQRGVRYAVAARIDGRTVDLFADLDDEAEAEAVRAWIQARSPR